MKEYHYTKLFENICIQRGWSFRPSGTRDDMKNHVDGYVTIYDKHRAVKTFSVDLKGDKYTSRANNGLADCLCQYVEFLNVRGDRGWLFGEAEIIAILNENQTGFYLVNRKKLIEFCGKLFNCNMNMKLSDIANKLRSKKDLWVDSAEQSYHRLYRRFNRPDEIITQIDYEDIRNLTVIKIEEKND